MKLEDFVKILPLIASKDSHAFRNGGGGFLVEEHICYPDDFPHLYVNFDPHGERMVFGLTFEDVPLERFPKDLLKSILELAAKDKKNRKVKLGLYWTSISFQDEKHDLSSLDSIKVSAFAREPCSDLPKNYSANILSANFGNSTFGDVYEMRLGGTGIYTRHMKALAKKFGLMRLSYRHSREFVNEYSSNQRKAQEDMVKLVRDIQNLNLDGLVQDISISGEQTTSLLELTRQKMPLMSGLYGVEIRDEKTTSQKSMRITRTPVSIELGYKIPSNSLYIKSENPSGEDGEFNFCLDTDSPTLLSLQDYACRSMGVSFK